MSGKADELRELLTEIQRRARTGLGDPAARAEPGTEVLIFGLGLITGTATRALEGELPGPRRVRLELSETAFARLIMNEAVVVQNDEGTLIELVRAPV